MGLGEETPDVLLRGEELAGCGVGRHRERKCRCFDTVSRATCANPADRLRLGEGLGLPALGHGRTGLAGDSAQAEQFADSIAQQPDEVAEPGRGDDGDHDRSEAGQGERCERP